MNVDYYYNNLGGYGESVGSNYYIVDNLTPLQSSLRNLTFFEMNTYPTGLQTSYPNASVPAAHSAYYVGYIRQTNTGIVVNANNFTLVYTALFKAPSTGVFQFCTSADNENDLYFGDGTVDGNAFSCKNGQPGTADDPLVQGLSAHHQNCAVISLTKGRVYPFRSAMGNWQGPSEFNLTYVLPGASVDIGSNDFSGLIYPHNCGIYV